MKNSKTVFQELVNRLSIHADRQEVESIAYLILEHLFSLSRTQVMSEKEVQLTGNQQSRLQEIVDRINRHEPVQYVLGECEFYGMRFKVNPSVLIPRPETEELVRLVADHLKDHSVQQPHVLDIATGSGCIAIALASEFPEGVIYGTDISQAALETASENNRMVDNRVQFSRNDILTEQLTMSELDIVASNPPYITEKEMISMNDNVLRYEPHLALFVPDNDPLRFYRSISAKAFNALKHGGLLAVEINEAYGRETAACLSAEGFRTVNIFNDLSGKHRIVTGIKP
jgi:release factor glutamine methyltransferase